jgi:16S rRNA G527 N7-methylase RsmG
MTRSGESSEDAAVRFEGFPLAERITDRARASGLELPTGAETTLANHALRVVRANAQLHLTTITEPEEFVERHIGESFEGAAMLEPGIVGTLLDLGSGNGYPGLVVAAARPGLRAVLAEASSKKAAFLRGTIEEGVLPAAAVLERQVQRAADVRDIGEILVLTMRAAGGWSKVVPKLVGACAADVRILLWAGDDLERIRRYEAWRRLNLLDRRPLPGRERSWVWMFGR